MSLSNIEKINEHFKVPILYNDKKVKLNENIITDLELIETIDPSGTPMYQYAFQPKTNFGKKVVEQLSLHYTTDINYLKDNQQLLKNYTPIKHEIFRPEFTHIMELWDEIKNDTGFKEKYQYIDWPFWEFLNKDGNFLQILSIYNLSSPVMSFFVPVIILIIPFFVIQMKGVNLSFVEYIEVLKVVASNHAIGKLFTKFNSVKLDEKMYLLISAAFYIFSIYQNVLTCIRFNTNMKKIHTYLSDIKKYIEYTENSANNFLSHSSRLNNFSQFNQNLKENIIILKQFKEKIERIDPYKVSIKKVMQFGHILKCFYELYENKEYNDAFMYSFGFNGYIDALEGLVDNVQKKNMQFAKFHKFTKKSKKSKKSGTKIVKSYYPALINNNPICNSINIDKNIIVTGPNASGKTTILKSSLINIIITQQMGCGFYSSASLTPYEHIHCYLNIPDTSGRDSLFQAEARRCKEIIDVIHLNPNQNHFCVFDELYSGTNPDEAVASASAFMNYLSKFRGVNCLLTTHFFDLCTHLGKNICFENFHMETVKDATKKFNYTYLLKKGISNVRGGVKVLEDMEYPQEIIANSSL
uniref:DNA mismatch repair proteins mutS family domain-containing protein n=1 Tax=viral metagenome TaxID=1070528 RepID=A0A6C0HCJ5_9ZZZZ